MKKYFKQLKKIALQKPHMDLLLSLNCIVQWLILLTQTDLRKCFFSPPFFLGIVHATKPKVLPLEPDNDTDVDKTLQQVCDNDSSLKKLNWNNIRVGLFYY